MPNLNWVSVQRVVSSLVLWIASKPIFALIFLLVLILSTNAISGWYIHRKMNSEMVHQLKKQAEEYEKKSKEKEQEFQKIINPLIEERDALKKRLIKIVPAKPPANETELIKRFKALGY